MPDYVVTVTGRAREVYIVTADTPEIAATRWQDQEASVLEVDDAEVQSVEQMTD